MGSSRSRRKLVRLRQRDNPDFTLRPSNERLREHLTELNAVLSIAEISRRSGVPEATIHGQRHGSKGHTKVLMHTAQALMRVQLTEQDRAEHMTPLEVVWGGYRIVQGLMVQGWTQAVIGSECALSEHMIRTVGRTPNDRCLYQLSRASYARLKEAAWRLETLDPIEDGKIPQRSSRNVRSRALGRGSAPITAWDLDEVHKVDARPEWTGACGTPEGYVIHFREEILPVCPACTDAVREETRTSGGRFSATKFRILMEERGFSAAMLAEKVDVSEDSIRRWAGGQRQPQPHLLDRIISALDCDKPEVMDHDGEEVYYDSDFKKSIFKATMEAKGWSVNRLAIEIGVSNMAVQYWRSGRNTPKIPNIVKAAEILGVDWKVFYQ